MAATKKATASKAKKSTSKKSDAKPKDSGRCWDGYEPVPGKKPGSKGSCKKKD